jgi:hypothetical protein
LLCHRGNLELSYQPFKWKTVNKLKCLWAQIVELSLRKAKMMRQTWDEMAFRERPTRRIIMRPVFTKPKAETAPPLPDIDPEAEKGATVAETQQPTGPAASGDDFSEDDVSEYASDCSHTPRRPKTQKKKAAAAAPTEAKGEEKEGTVKKVVRKVKATANANYRRIKIKSKGGTGGGAGGKGRFGRRK